MQGRRNRGARVPPLFFFSSLFFASKQKKNALKDIYQKVKGCQKEEQELMPHIVHVIELLLVNPVTSCTLERSFSTAWRLKISLRATMKSRRFKSLTTLNIHRDVSDKLEYSSISKSLFSINVYSFFHKWYSGFLGLHFFQNIFHTVNFQIFCVSKAFASDLISKYKLDLKCV